MAKIVITSSIELSASQKEKLEKGLLPKLDKGDNISFSYEIDKTIAGIRVFDGQRVLDVSGRYQVNQLRNRIDNYMVSLDKGISVNDIPDLLKSKIKEFANLKQNHRMCGKIISSAGGIVHIEGLKDCKYKEIILIGEKGFALTMNLEKDYVGAILLSGLDTVSYGDMVYTTGKVIEVPVGYEFLGRVIDPLGKAIDGRPQVVTNKSWRIENPAPRIIDRDKVNEPLYTGILAVDSMIPIGKGQRELIIGDRQTGKTSIIIDTIINQKGKNVYCIYVAIGQRSSEINKLVKTLEEHGAMSYTTVILSAASDLSSLQYIAPYTGAALADFFMYEGKDVLIAYDDLSKHAVAYRTISLLLKRPAGREAFPGDIFYIHSKLLERASKLSEKMGGGSITALPVIETQAGDISAYIPTNVISITDGQIYLEKELFKSGQRPAINVGLSVSRIGGAAQTSAMRKLSSRLRLDIAHYRELAIFSQFGSSLDLTTKEILNNGKKIEEVICQVDYNPYDYLREVIYLYAATNKLLKDIPDKKIAAYLDLLYNYIHSNNQQLAKEIGTSNDVSEEKLLLLEKVIKEFTSYYLEAK